MWSWPGKHLHWRIRRRLISAINFLNAFNHYDRLKAESRDDPIQNLIVPAEESLTQGGIWVVEFFPPSHYSALDTALRKSGWDKRNLITFGGTNSERVREARRGNHPGWSLLGRVTTPHSKYLVPDAIPEKLPEEFDLIELSAVHLGSSLTAVVAFVILSEQGRAALHRVWTAQHEPSLTWRGLSRPHVEDRRLAGIRATQQERQRLHDLARTWLARHCGGYFAQTKSRQPVVDLNIFSHFDPLSSRESWGSLGQPLQALGMEGDFLYNYVSPQIDGAVLVKTESSWHSSGAELLQNCWGVVANNDVFTQHNKTDGYGNPSARTFAWTVKDEVRSFLLYTAVLRYSEQLGEIFSDARDTARSKYRSFKPHQLDQLKHELLTTSLDLPTVARDSAVLWEGWWRSGNGIDVKAVPAPGVVNPPEEFDLVEQWGEARSRRFTQLMEEDEAYRDVLSTVSSLGASATDARLGRRALVVSFASLVVALAALLTTGDPTVLEQLIDWIAPGGQ